MKRVFGLILALRALALSPGNTSGPMSDPEAGILGVPLVARAEESRRIGWIHDREIPAVTRAPRAVFICNSFTFGVIPFDQNFPYRVVSSADFDTLLM